MTVTDSAVHPPATHEIAARRRELTPEIHQAFDAFSRHVFADGALPGKTKQLIAAGTTATRRPPG